VDYPLTGGFGCPDSGSTLINTANMATIKINGEEKELLIKSSTILTLEKSTGSPVSEIIKKISENQTDIATIVAILRAVFLVDEAKALEIIDDNDGIYLDVISALSDKVTKLFRVAELGNSEAPKTEHSGSDYMASVTESSN
jgi:hypothetical protein